MNPALRYLLARRIRGGARRMARRFSTTRGKLLLLALAVVAAGLVASQFLLLGGEGASAARGSFSADDVRLVAPPLLLLVALLGTRAHGLYFQPAEEQLLFPAPIPRRQLLLYNVLSRMQVALFSAAWGTLFAIRFAGTWLGAFLALFLILAFNQLLGQLVGLSLAALRERGRVFWARAAVPCLALAIIVPALLPLLTRADGIGTLEVLHALVEAPTTRAAGLLTRPMVEIFLAPDLGTTLTFGALSLALLALLVLAIVRLDGVHVEALALAQGRAKRDRTRRRRGAGHRARGAGMALPLRRMPHLAGAGPLAWRQIQEIARTPSLALRGGLGLLAIAPIYLFRFVGQDLPPAELGLALLFALVLILPMLVDGADFRRDVDRMASLRALPISPMAMALGQVMPTALLLCVWMWIGAAFVGNVSAELPAGMLLMLGAAIPPFALLTAALDNLIFLLFPYRPRTMDPGESTFMGRVTIIMVVKMMVVLAVMVACALITVVTFGFVEPTPMLVGLVIFQTLALCCLPAIAAVAWAYRRFDVAQQVPE